MTPKEKIYLKFERRAEVLEVGGCSVYVDEGDTWEDIIDKAEAGELAEFQITDRAYVNEQVSFGPFDEDDDDDDEEDNEYP